MEVKNIEAVLDYFIETKKDYIDILVQKNQYGEKKEELKTHSTLNWLVFPIYGCAKFTLENKEYILKPGFILNIGPDIDLSKEIIGDDPWCCLIVLYDILNETKFKHSIQNSHFIVEIGASVKVLCKLNQLFQRGLSIEIGNIMKAKVLFNELIEEIVKLLKNSKYGHANKFSMKDIQMMNEVIYYIQSNYDKPLSVNDIAKEFGIERRRLGYLFKLYTEVTPTAYIRKFKIYKAQYLLKFSDFQVMEIARGLGYEDYFYFSKKFKETVGVSPSQFRNEVKEKH